MKIQDFINLLSDHFYERNLEQEAEILVEGEDGTLYDFSIDDTEEQFDGFDTFYPAGLKIVVKHES